MTTTDVTIDFIVSISGKDVKLEPNKSIDAKNNGLDLVLSDKVEIGPIPDLKDLLETMTPDSIDLPQFDRLPSPFNELFGESTSLDFVINELTINVPSTVNDDDQTHKSDVTFKLGLSATCEEPINLIKNKLAIKEVCINVVRK